MGASSNGAPIRYPLVARMPAPERGPRDRERARTDLFVGLQVAVALLLLLLVVVYVPRPNIRLTAARFEASPCNQGTSSLVVTAYVSLTNTGRSDGDIFVRLYVDGPRRASEDFFVPAETTVNRSLNVEVTDCASHHYSVDTCFPRSRSEIC